MDYKKAWEDLKNWVELGLYEGKDRGFDKETPTNRHENGMYEAYCNVKNKMMYAELHQN